MYDLIAPVLYSDCTPFDFIAFAAGLRTNENIDFTTRLHVRGQRRWMEASYEEIINSGWDMFETKTNFNMDSVPLAINLAGVLKECQALVQEGKRLRQLITEGLTILPNLRTVSMGGIGEQVFNGMWAETVERRFNPRFEATSKVLPHAFIDLPTVQDYCQAVSNGPLALPSKIIKVKSPLRIFTHHPRGGHFFSSCSHGHEIRSPPIILGAINRYYTEKALLIPYFENGHPRINVKSLLEPLVAMLSRRAVYVANPVTGVPTIYHGPSSDFDGTVIEVYGYVRLLPRWMLDSSLRASLDPANNMHDLPPQALAMFQATLDRDLPSKWKGKVWLKNREDAPPCPACGLNPEEEFQMNKGAYKFSPGAGMGSYAHAH